MSLVDAYGRTFSVEQRSTDLGPFKQWIRGFDMESPEGRLDSPVKQHIACFRCVNLIGQIIARIPFEIWRGDALEIQTRAVQWRGMSKLAQKRQAQQILSGPMVSLFKKPNDVMAWPKFVHTVSSHLQTNGNFYILKDGLTSRQIPQSLKPLDPERVDPERVKGDPFAIKSWLYRTNYAAKVPIPLEEIAHGEYAPDPKDPLKGIGPLGVARLTIEGDYAAAVFNRSLLRRGGQPGAVLKYTGTKKIGDEKREEIADEWAKKFGGSSAGNRLAVLTGEFDYQPISISPRDMQFIVARDWNLKDIARAFNVPLVFLNEFQSHGLGDAGLRVLYRMLYESTIIPLTSQIADSITSDILAPFDDSLVAVFNFDTVEALREDLNAKAATAEIFVRAGWSPNSVNNRLDMGFDDIEGGDESLVAATLTTRKALVAQAEADIEAINNPPEPAPPSGFFAGNPALLPAPDGTDPNQPALPAPDPKQAQKAVLKRMSLAPPGARLGKTTPPTLQARRSGVAQRAVKTKLSHPTLKAWLAYLDLLAPLEKRGVQAVRKGLNKERKKVLAALGKIPAQVFAQHRCLKRRSFYARVLDLLFDYEAHKTAAIQKVAEFMCQREITQSDIDKEIEKILEDIRKIDDQLNTKITGEQQTAGPVVVADNDYMNWVLSNFDASSIANTMKPISMDAFRIGAASAQGMLFNLGVKDEDAIRVSLERIPKLANSFWDARIGKLVKSGTDTKEAVRNALLFGWGEGDQHIPGWTEGGSLADLMDAVRKVFNGEMSFSRARTIARTEINSAQNEGRYDELAREGVKQKQWLTAGDEKVRDSHVACAEEGPIDFDQPFGNGCMQPGDDAGGPSEVINCRCTFVPVLSDEDLQIIGEAQASLNAELDQQDQEQGDLSSAPIELPTEAPLDDALTGDEIQSFIGGFDFRGDETSWNDYLDANRAYSDSSKEYDSTFQQLADAKDKAFEAFSRTFDATATESDIARWKQLQQVADDLNIKLDDLKEKMRAQWTTRQELLKLVKQQDREILYDRVGDDRLGDKLSTEYKSKGATPQDSVIAAHKEAEDFIRNVASGKIVGTDSGENSVTYAYTGGPRASYENYNHQLNMSEQVISSSAPETVATVVHELGHALEEQNPHILDRAVEFLMKRARDSSADIKSMNDLTDSAGYGSSEKAINDKFAGGYAGKIYLKGGADSYPGPIWEWPKDRFRATEVVSMGLQQLYVDPALFAKEDPEYFAFIVKLIQGDI